MDPTKQFNEIKNGTLQEIANFFNRYPELVGRFSIWYLEDRLTKPGSQSAPMDRVLQMFNWIIMGGSPTETLEQMRERGLLKSSVCSYVWRTGATAYRCRTCEMDSSCGICIQCFENGDHKGHDFGIISVTGGCCDCGDPQTWKPSGFCKNHKGKSPDDPSPAYIVIPQAIQTKLRTVCNTLLTYAKDGITRRKIESEATEIAIWLQKWSRESDGFRALIAEIVENTPGLLRDLFNIDHQLGDRLHTEIFGLYHSLLIESSFKHYFLKTFIEFYPICFKRKEEEILTSEEGELVSEDEPDEEIHNLGDDLNGLIENFSIDMFTSEELSSRAVRELNLFEVLLTLLHDSLQKTLQPTSNTSSVRIVREKHRILTRRLYATLTSNLRLTLQHHSNTQVFLNNYFKNPTSNFIEILSWIEGMNPNTRISSGPHVDFDSSFWITAFIVELDILTLLPHLREGFVTLPDANKRIVLVSLVRALAARMQERRLPLNTVTSRSYPFIPLITATGEADSENRTYAEIISFHAPVHRYLASFIHCEASRAASQGVIVSLEDLLDVRNQPQQFLLYLINYSLDLQVLLSQIRAGLWRRNGTMLWAQSITYKSVHSFELMFDQDIMLLQCGAVLMDRNHFVAALLGKFQLEEFFGLGLKPEQTEKEKDEKDKEKKSIEQQRLEEQRVKAEDFLQLIITVASERTKLGLTEEETIRRAIIHRLCAGDTSHSELTKNVNKRYAKHPKFESILKEVSNYNVPHGMEQGTYTLKPECWKEFDRFYTHYNQKDLQTAEERFREYKKSSDNNVGVNTALFVKLYPTFVRVVTVLHSNILHAAIFSVLYHVVAETTPKSSETLVAEAIHLLDLSLRSLTLFSELRSHLSQQAVGTNNNQKASAEGSYFSFDTIRFTSGYILANALQLISVPKVPSSSSSTSGLGVDEQESILSLLFKLGHKQETEYKSTVQSLLTLFSELDPASKTAIDVMGEKMEQLQSQSATSAAERKRKARERQQAILASFQKQQQAFKFLEEEEEEPEETTTAEPAQKGPAEVEFSTECALCKEPSNSLHHRPVGYVAFIQRSRVLATAKKQVLAKQENRKEEITPEVHRHSVHSSPARPQDVVQGSESVFSGTGRRRRHESDSDEEGTDTDSLDMEDFLNRDDEDGDDVPIHEEVDDDDIVRALSFMCNLMYGNSEDFPIPPAFEGEDMALEGDEEGEDEDEEEEGEEGDGEEEEEGDELEDDEDEFGGDEDDGDGEEEYEDWMDAIPMGEDGMSDSEDEDELWFEDAHNEVYTGTRAEGGMEAGSDTTTGGEKPADNIMERLGAQDLFRNWTTTTNVHVQCCGHQIHIECFDRYFGALLRSHIQNQEYEGDSLIDLENMEFLCPVCRRMGNTLIPLVPNASIRASPTTASSSSFTAAPDFDAWLRATQATLTSISNTVNSIPPTKDESSPLPANFTPLEGSMDQLVSKIVSIQRKIGHDKVTPDERVTPLLWSALGATVASAELANRENPSLIPFPDQQTARLMKCLMRAGLAHRRKYQTDPEGKWATKTTLRRQKQLDLLRQILAGEAAVNNNKDSALLLLDLFGVLVRLVILWPSDEFTAPDFYHLLKLIYVAHLAQIQVYISCILSKVDSISERLNRWKLHFPKVTKVDEVTSLESLYQFVDGCARGGVTTLSSFPAPSSSMIPQNNPALVDYYELVQRLSSTFLNCAAIFLNTCLELPPNVIDPPSPVNNNDYPALLSYLHLPTPQVALAQLSPAMKWILHAWCRDLSNRITVASSTVSHISEGEVPDTEKIEKIAAPEPFHLLPLPNVYQDLFTKYLNVACSLCGTVSHQTGLCLLCGAVVCADNDCCSTHASRCGAGLGVFLIVNTTAVLLLRGTRFCFWGSPYLDEHGEEDPELRRSKPLYLSQSRYSQLKKLYVTHTMDHDSHVLANSSREDHFAQQFM